MASSYNKQPETFDDKQKASNLPFKIDDKNKETSTTVDAIVIRPFPADESIEQSDSLSPHPIKKQFYASLSAASAPSIRSDLFATASLSRERQAAGQILYSRPFEEVLVNPTDVPGSGTKPDSSGASSTTKPGSRFA